GVITVDKIWGAAARAQYVIAEREHGAGDRVENRGRGFVIGAVAPRDVPGAHQDLARYHHGGADARRTRAGGARASGADRLVLCARCQERYGDQQAPQRADAMSTRRAMGTTLATGHTEPHARFRDGDPGAMRTQES